MVFHEKEMPTDSAYVGTGNVPVGTGEYPRNICFASLLVISYYRSAKVKTDCKYWFVFH